MTINLYVLLYMLSTVLYVQSEPGIFEKKNNIRAVNRDWKNWQENGLQSADIVKNVGKRDVSEPLQNAGEQLSTFVSYVNAVSLAESIGQKLTTFGEIGVNFMLVQNMPTHKNGIYSIDSKNIRMENDGDLRNLMENGFDGNVSIDVIEKIMMIEEEISAIDSLPKAFEKIKNVSAVFNITAFFNPSGRKEGLLFLDTLPEIFTTLSLLSTKPALLNSLKRGSEIIKTFKNINIKKMKTSFEFCKINIRSDECDSGFAVLRGIPSDEISADGIETVAVLLKFLSSKEEFTKLEKLIKDKMAITGMHDNLSKLQNLIGTTMDLDSMKRKFANIFSSFDGLKNKNLEFQEISEALKVFQPVSEAIVKMHNGQQDTSPKRSREAQVDRKSVLETIRRFPKGIISLNELSERTRKFAPPPDEYQDSKLSARTRIMEEFATQRVEFLKFAKGIGSIQYISTLIKNIEFFLSRVPNYKILAEQIESIWEDNKNLASVKNLADGVDALKDVETRLQPLTEEKWKSLTNSAEKVSFDEEQLREVLTMLAGVIEYAKKIDNHMNTDEEVDEEMFLKAIKVSEKLYNVIKKNENRTLVVKNSDITAIRSLIAELDSKNLNLKNGTIPIGTIVNNLEHAKKAHLTIETIMESNRSQLESGIPELEKLKTEDTKRPSQKELDAFKPMMTELNSLEKLEFSSADENNKLCPELTILAKSQNNDLLRDLSKGFNHYRRLIRGIPSIENLNHENVESPAKELLYGVEAIQILVAKDEISAYDVFYNSQTIDEQLDKLVTYIDKIMNVMSDNLRRTIAEEANPSHAHRFISRLSRSAATSISDMRRTISVILMGLKNRSGCKKIMKDLTNYFGTTMNDKMAWYMVVFWVATAICGIGSLIGSVVLISLWLVGKEEAIAKKEFYEEEYVIKKIAKSRYDEENSSSEDFSLEDLYDERSGAPLKNMWPSSRGKTPDPSSTPNVPIRHLSTEIAPPAVPGTSSAQDPPNAVPSKSKKGGKQKVLSTIPVKAPSLLPSASSAQASSVNTPSQLPSSAPNASGPSQAVSSKSKKGGKQKDLSTLPVKAPSLLPSASSAQASLVNTPSQLPSSVPNASGPSHAVSSKSKKGGEQKDVSTMPVKNPSLLPTSAPNASSEQASSANTPSQLPSSAPNASGPSHAVSSKSKKGGGPKDVSTMPVKNPSLLPTSAPNASSEQASSVNTPSQLPSSAPNASGPSQAVSSKSKKGGGPKDVSTMPVKNPSLLPTSAPNASSEQASSVNTPSQLPSSAPNASGPSQAVSSKSKKGGGPKDVSTMPVKNPSLLPTSAPNASSEQASSANIPSQLPSSAPNASGPSHAMSSKSKKGGEQKDVSTLPVKAPSLLPSASSAQASSANIPSQLPTSAPNASSEQASSAKTPSQLPNPAPNASGPSYAVSSKSKKGGGPKVEKSSKNNQSKRK